MHQRASLDSGHHPAIDDLGHHLRASRFRSHETERILEIPAEQDHATARTTERLVGRRCDDMAMLDRGVEPALGDQSGRVRHVGHQERADFARYLAERLVVDVPAVCRRSYSDHLRPVLLCHLAHRVVVDQPGLRIDSIGDEVVELAGEVDRRSMGKMAAVRQIHAEHCIAMLNEREVDSHVRRGAGVWLHVGVLGAEKLLHTVLRQRLGDIDPFASTVISLAGISFGVFVGEHRALRLEHGLADEVLAGDQLDLVVLAMYLAGDCCKKLGVLITQGIVDHGKMLGIAV